MIDMENYILSKKIYNNVKNCFVDRGSGVTTSVTLPPHEASNGFSRYIVTTHSFGFASVNAVNLNMTIPVVLGNSSKIFPFSITVIDTAMPASGVSSFIISIAIGSKTRQLLTLRATKTSQTLCFERTFEDFYIR